MNTPTIPAFVLPFLVMGGILVGTAQPSAAGETLCGGYSDAHTANDWVVAAAQFAVKAQTAAPEQKTAIALVGILGAEQQVVAGMNYRLRLKVKVDGTVRDADAVVWRKLSGEHKLTSWTWK